MNGGRERGRGSVSDVPANPCRSIKTYRPCRATHRCGFGQLLVDAALLEFLELLAANAAVSPRFSKSLINCRLFGGGKDGGGIVLACCTRDGMYNRGGRPECVGVAGGAGRRGGDAIGLVQSLDDGRLQPAGPDRARPGHQVRSKDPCRRRGEGSKRVLGGVRGLGERHAKTGGNGGRGQVPRHRKPGSSMQFSPNERPPLLLLLLCLWFGPGTCAQSNRRRLDQALRRRRGGRRRQGAQPRGRPDGGPRGGGGPCVLYTPPRPRAESVSNLCRIPGFQQTHRGLSGLFCGRGGVLQEDQPGDLRVGDDRRGVQRLHPGDGSRPINPPPLLPPALLSILSFSFSFSPVRFPFPTHPLSRWMERGEAS